MEMFKRASRSSIHILRRSSILSRMSDATMLSSTEGTSGSSEDSASSQTTATSVCSSVVDLPTNGKSVYNDTPSSVSDPTEGENIRKSPRLAPQVTNIENDEHVCQQVVLIEGYIPAKEFVDGHVTLRYSQDKCPPTKWPVVKSQFKALAYLNSGQNNLHLDFESTDTNEVHTSDLAIVHRPIKSCPPLQLAILFAKDSTFIRDSSSESGKSSLTAAMASFRTASYLWQAFLAERMNTREIGRRTFQLENEWKESTLYSSESHRSRAEAVVHAIKLEETIEELKGLSSRQLVDCAEKALMKRFASPPHQKRYFACVFLDSTWDQERKSATPSVSYGGPGHASHGRINLAISGGHFLFAYPQAIDRVSEAFSDCSFTAGLPVQTKWECATVGLAEHLRQIGYMLGLPDQNQGIVARDHARINRAFSYHEPWKKTERPASAKTHRLEEFEPRIHPLEVMRLGYHPIFRGPFAERGVRRDLGVEIWGASASSIFVTSRVGIAAVEILLSGDGVCDYWFDFLDDRGRPRHRIEISTSDLAKKVPPSRSSGPFALRILTVDGRSTPIIDFARFASRLVARTLGDKTSAFLSAPIGGSVPISAGPTTPQTVVFPRSSTRLLAIRAYHVPGAMLHGIEFVFEGDRVHVFGTRAGIMSEFRFMRDSVEFLAGFVVRAGERVSGLRVFTSLGRRSDWFGAMAGIEYKLIPPETYSIAGLTGDAGAFIASLQLIIAR